MDNTVAIAMCKMTWCHVIGLSSSRMAEACRLAPCGYKGLFAAFVCLDGCFFDKIARILAQCCELPLPSIAVVDCRVMMDNWKGSRTSHKISFLGGCFGS